MGMDSNNLNAHFFTNNVYIYMLTLQHFSSDELKEVLPIALVIYSWHLCSRRYRSVFTNDGGTKFVYHFWYTNMAAKKRPE